MTGRRESELGRQAYDTAVKRLRELIHDPEQCNSDEVLTTIFVLDFHDSYNLSIGDRPSSAIHLKGAIAILETRAYNNLNSPHSRRLFDAIRNRYINYSLDTFQLVQRDPCLLSDDTAILPSAKLDLLKAKLATLRVAIQQRPRPSQGEYFQLVLDEAQSLENGFQAWEISLPLLWKPLRFAASEIDPSIRQAGVCEDMCDVYSSLNVSEVRNEARASQMEILNIIAWCSRNLQRLGVSIDGKIETRMHAQCQSILNDFCASIPFHLGNRTDVAFVHDRQKYPPLFTQLLGIAQYVDPLGNTVEMTEHDHVRAATTRGSAFFKRFVESMLRAPASDDGDIRPSVLAAGLKKDQVQWLSSQAERIRRIYPSYWFS